MSTVPQRSLKGKRILLTGATGSLGEATARELCAQGAHLLLPVRNPAKGEALRQALLSADPNANVTLYPLDMTDLGSIRRLAEQLLAQGTPLDALIHYAGILTTTGQRTAEGVELHRQVTCLSPLLLTEELLPLLQAADDPLVLTVTSLSAFYLSDNAIHADESSATRLYARSKRNLLGAMEALAAQHPRITFLYAHPGVCATGLFTGETHQTAYNETILRMALPLMRKLFMTPEKACRPGLFALRHGIDGQLAEPRGLLQIWGKPRLVPLGKRYRKG